MENQTPESNQPENREETINPLDTIKTSMKEGILKGSKTLTIVGILILAVGIIAVVYPQSFGEISTQIIGFLIIVSGFMRFMFAVLSPSMGSMIWRYLFAVLMIIAGVWIIMNPEMGLDGITIAMAVYFLVDGITSFVYSFSLRPIGGGAYLLFNGIIGIVLGILIFYKWPESSNFVLGIYLGIKLIIDGINLTLTGQGIRKTVKSIAESS